MSNEPHPPKSTLSRRYFLGGVAGAVGAAGVYELVERLTRAPARPEGVSPAGPLPTLGVPPEQHLLNDVTASRNGKVLIPPRHFQILTGRLRLSGGKRALLAAKRRLDEALDSLDERFDPTRPSGLGVTLAWGLPYFRGHVPGPAGAHLPVDLKATEARGSKTLAVLEAVRFPSDPPGTILEQNDFAVLLRSDYLAHLEAGTKALLGALGPDAELMSVRKGFVGGGFGGAASLPKRMAMAAGVPGAEQIPETAELFMGFTSTQAVSQGPPQNANFETWPGDTDQWPDGYFRYGTAMHLSHVREDLEAWYASGYPARLAQMFHPGLDAKPGTQTLPQGPDKTQDLAAVRRDAATGKPVGHAGSLQPVTRLQVEVTDNYGNVYPPGTARFRRADSNTVDNPFAMSARPERDGYSTRGAAGIHFAGLTSTSDLLNQARLAMDGRYRGAAGKPDTVVADPNAPGINPLMTTTHRQNFLVPPREHRSFPLAELL